MDASDRVTRIRCVSRVVCVYRALTITSFFLLQGFLPSLGCLSFHGHRTPRFHETGKYIRTVTQGVVSNPSLFFARGRLTMPCASQITRSACAHLPSPSFFARRHRPRHRTQGRVRDDRTAGLILSARHKHTHRLGDDGVQSTVCTGCVSPPPSCTLHSVLTSLPPQVLGCDPLLQSQSFRPTCV
jgi:hypothetical protein